MTNIKPGMLIRGLRGGDAIDTVLSVDASHRHMWVATKSNPSGVRQYYADPAEVRWPWEDTWTPLTPKHEPARGDLYVHRDSRSTYMVVESHVGLRLVCVSGHDSLGFYWSHECLFDGADSDFEYVGRAEDILRVDA